MVDIINEAKGIKLHMSQTWQKPTTLILLSEQSNNTTSKDNAALLIDQCPAQPSPVKVPFAVDGDKHRDSQVNYVQIMEHLPIIIQNCGISLPHTSP